MKTTITFVLALVHFSLFTFHFSITSAQTVPVHDHVVIVIEENHGYDSIIGSALAPYINSLATDSHGALFTQSFALTHPSQPNYLNIFSGATQSVLGDITPFSFLLPFTTANLGAELLSAGRTFAGYSEGMPSVGYTADTYNSWARKHCPWINWQGTGTNGIPAELNVPYTAFPSNYDSLPTVSFVIPDLDNDMHNGTIAAGDSWLNTNLSNYITWSKTHNSLFILTFDEDDGILISSNQITTIFVGQNVKQGQYSEHIDHYTLLRTLEDMYGLSYAGGSGSGYAPITDCWLSISTGSSASPMNLSAKVQVIPNPFNESAVVKIGTDLLNDGKEFNFSLFDLTGRKVLEHLFANAPGNAKTDLQFKINRNDLKSGFYFYLLNNGEETLAKGKMVIE